MRCSECRQARRFAHGAVMCILYGMIISENHECEREGQERKYEDDDSQRGTGEDETEIRHAGGGAAGEMPGVL